jgi:hypothetical protein
MLGHGQQAAWTHLAPLSDRHPAQSGFIRNDADIGVIYVGVQTLG